MKKIITLIIAIILLFTTCLYATSGCAKKPADNTVIGESLRVMSYNIMVWNEGNDFQHEWPDRCAYVLSDITMTQPDIIGFQEVGAAQYEWLKNSLEGYASVIEYRDDNIVSEACPVFYSQSKYSLVSNDTFWLSETPSVMSKDWGAEYYRICTYVILNRLSDGKQFAFYNTHLDNTSECARINGIKTLLNMITQNNLPCIVTGDLNAHESSETYGIIAEALCDTCLHSPNTQDGATYQNWGNNLDAKRIDYIFCSKEYRPQKYAILSTTHDGIYASDHFAIYAELFR